MAARYGGAGKIATPIILLALAVAAAGGTASAQSVEADSSGRTGPHVQGRSAQDAETARFQAEVARRAAENAEAEADESRRAAQAALAAQSVSAGHLARIVRSADHVRQSAAAAEAAAARAEAAADDSARSPFLPTGCSAGDDVGTRFQNGVSWSRRCARNYIRSLRRDGLMAGDDEWRRVLNGSEALADFYLARSDRQQTIIDGGSAVTGAGALGAGLSAAAGPHTVLMWGYGALLGVMTVEFTGSQPTRDLYSAGHIGLGYIVNRYSILYGSLQEVEQAERPDVNQACGNAGAANSATRRLAEVEAWAGGDDKAAFLPLVRRLVDTCRRLRQGDGDLNAMVRRTSRQSEDWPTALATDLLALDEKVADRDARLRMTPGSALTAAAVGPLRLLDSLISGENTQEAVSRLRINALLDDMAVQLTPVRVQAPPLPINGAIELTPDFESRAAASGSDRPRMLPQAQPANGAPVQPTNAQIGEMATWVRDQLPLIETARTVHNDRVFHAGELHEAARRSVLQFDYQVATGAATVQLTGPEPRAPDAGGTANALTVKDEGPPVMPLPAG